MCGVCGGCACLCGFIVFVTCVFVIFRCVCGSVCGIVIVVCLWCVFLRM